MTTNTAAADTSRSSKQEIPQTWAGMLKQTAVEWTDDDTMTWAAAVACFTVLALAPLLVIAMKVLAVLQGKSAGQQLQTQMVQWMGPASGQALGEIISRAGQHTSLFATIFSLVVAVISAGGVFSELQRAMNRIWKVQPKPGRALWGFLWARLLSLIVVSVAAVILLASVAVATWLGHLTAALGPVGKYLTWIVDVLVSIGVLTLLFGMLYRTLPDARIAWRTTWVGAFLSALLFEVGKYGLTLYFKFAAPSSPFGAVGSLAAVLIWIYYSSLIVFFGAEFTQVYAKARHQGVLPSKHARVLSQCDETETATPSSEEPGHKPPRPAKQSPREQRRRDPDAIPLSGALVPHQVAGFERQVAPSVSRTTATLAAAGGLVLGAVIGGLGAVKGGLVTGLNRRQISSAALWQRLRLAEHKVARASRIKRFLESEDVSERVAALEQQVCASPRHQVHDGRWIHRMVEAVKSFV